MLHLICCILQTRMGIGLHGNTDIPFLRHRPDCVFMLLSSGLQPYSRTDAAFTVVGGKTEHIQLTD